MAIDVFIIWHWHTYSGNHTQTLFCNCFAIVVLEVIVNYLGHSK